MVRHWDKLRFSAPVFESLESRTLLSALPVVSIVADTPSASENGDAGQFTVARDVVTDKALKVGLSISGTATNSKDYAKLPSSVVIPANEASVVVTIQPIDDGKTETAETVVLTVKPGKTYVVDPAARSDTATIADATYLAADFFPLVDGARWDGIFTQGRERGHGVIGILDAGGGTFTWVLGGSLDPNSPDNEVDTLVVGEDGVEYAIRRHPDGDTNTFDPPLLLIPREMHPDDVITDEAIDTSDNSHRQTTITVLGVKTVTVPAGRFVALKLKSVITSDSYPGSEITTMWLARGIGMVKMDTRRPEPNAIPVTGEITSYSIDSPWLERASMNDARDQFTGGVIDGKIYVFGGNGNPDVNLKSTEVYDPATNTWTRLADNENNGGQGVEELTGAAVNGKLYVFGALGGGNVNFVQEYDPATDEWTTKKPKPTCVGGGPCVVYNGEIYVFGGFGAGVQTVKVVEAYNPMTDTWRFVTNMPKAMINPAVAVVGDTAYVLGGATGTSPKNARIQTTPLAYNFVTGKWITKGLAKVPAAHIVSYSSAAPVVDGKIYLVGGVGGMSGSVIWATNRIDVYDPATNTWSSGPSLPAPREDCLSVVLDDTLYIIGGDQAGGSASQTGGDDPSLADVLALPLT